MLVFSLSPTLGVLSGLAIALVVAIVALVVVHDRKPVNVAHDPEAEIRRLTLKVRHPWKARVSRWMGVD